jgi:TatD DNase family protein
VQQPLFTDSHSHIYAPEFDADREVVLQTARQDGVHRICMPNVDRDSFPRMLQVASEHPDTCFPMLGLHPCSVNGDFETDLSALWEQRQVATFIGIGETGIDLYWDKTFVEQQKEALRIQAEWAVQLGLPLILHVRDSFDEVCAILDTVMKPGLRGIFHCFTGTLPQAQRVLDYQSFMLGIGGVVTFKNIHLKDVLSHLDPGCLLLETDAPYLAPVPHRGKRNESSFMLHTASFVAGCLGMTVYELSALTERNAQNMFQFTV